MRAGSGGPSKIHSEGMRHAGPGQSNSVFVSAPRHKNANTLCGLVSHLAITSGGSIYLYCDSGLLGSKYYHLFLQFLHILRHFQELRILLLDLF
jgi:hypothetical protein